MVMDRFEHTRRGPEAGERMQFVLESILLKDGKPLWHALLGDPDAPAPDEEEVRNAKAWLREVSALHEQAILSCRGKNLEEAQQILQAIRDIRATGMVL